MRSQRQIMTLVLVLGLGLAVGMLFLLNRDPGVDAEVVQGPAGPVTGDSAVVVLCAPAGSTLARSPGAPARAAVLINRSTELLDQRKRSPARFQPEDLKPGAHVRLWTGEQMMMSDPPQLVAVRIALISDPVEGRTSLCAP